ncbi:MAG: hypothetical protein GEU94_12290 [Micromonosporaceae bacterium]|nr:hypothetical protein [Micromonosporaceae bacterium]
MFEEILGLPTHPLWVHAPVVLVPSLIVVAVGYALLPFARNRVDWALAGLAVAAPLTVAVARESGEAFRRRLAERGALAPGLAEQLDAHAAYARTLLLLPLALAATSFGLMQVERSGGPGVGSPSLWWRY